MKITWSGAAAVDEVENEQYGVFDILWPVAERCTSAVGFLGGSSHCSGQRAAMHGIWLQMGSAGGESSPHPSH